MGILWEFIFIMCIYKVVVGREMVLNFINPMRNGDLVSCNVFSLECGGEDKGESPLKR